MSTEKLVWNVSKLLNRFLLYFEYASINLFWDSSVMKTTAWITHCPNNHIYLQLHLVMQIELCLSRFCDISHSEVSFQFWIFSNASCSKVGPDCNICISIHSPLRMNLNDLYDNCHTRRSGELSYSWFNWTVSTAIAKILIESDTHISPLSIVIVNHQAKTSMLWFMIKYLGRTTSA